MKIYPLLPLALVTAAFAQTPAPKSPAPKPAAPPAQHATPGQTAATPPVKGPFADTDPNRVIATIGTEKMTAAQFDSIVDSLPQQYQAQVRGPARRQFMDQLVMIKVLARQALIMHIDQLPATQQQLAFAKDNILANMAGKAMVENTKVDSDALHKYFDDNKGDYQAVSAHHILIRFKGSPIPLKEGQTELTEEEALAKAQEVQKKLKDGGDFATIAAAESADTNSATQGGDLGAPIKRGQTLKQFEDAAFSLPAGEISDPVKSQVGYHIIRVDKVETKNFEEAKPEIEAKLKPQIAKKQMDELQKTVSVKLDDTFFGPATPPAAGPTGPPVNPN